MKWPRGKYNGQRIVGFNVQVKLDVTYWTWRPVWLPFCHGLHWGCCLTWWNLNYELGKDRSCNTLPRDT